ncbi:hypothetical protein H4218_001518 [Coemansia sp. IMI 209128]|nr:hypothetical protein GGI10_003359 [Coemansia sp. RSA 2530]KAJ2701225.1 hypothetical protein H4218_001518 [Coemansia sp. IMI 209128]
MSTDARGAIIRASMPSLEHYDGAQLWGTRPSTTIGTRILKSLARARAAIIHNSPPAYSRGAWAIINDVPFPPPPPYAGSSRHPPTYAEALEIGVVASPLRAEERLHCGCHPNMSPPVSSGCREATNRTSGESVEATASSHNCCTTHLVTLPGDGYGKDELLPKYADIEDVPPVSLVVRQWRLGQAAFEKPPRHPRGFTNYRSHASHR